ncbi:MlaD family protein [Marinospirillum insulare]|uniref:ABC transporter substrate-binding protein n=1 Tax=Marinospirillum insulare TaxID=217169 RepID=A0ABQ5ZUE3_9GAMM|nr:MlaD family protein [Marinospirillum insulare]GLR62888.1 ABC transporter substrate-binding protein [Marinospirillum insulare]
MNPKINYTLVGGFVVLLILAGLFFIGYMTQDSRNTDRVAYVTYFYDSVSGLNERAAVKYRGVPVGYVEKISLVNDPEERVKLSLRLDNDLPIRKSTFATLQFQGITGLLFIDLHTSDTQGERLETSEKQPATIASQSSRLGEITEKVDVALQNFNQLTKSLNQLTDQLSVLTNQRMQQQVSSLLTSLEQLSNTAEERISAFEPQVFNQLAHDFSDSTKELQASLTQELQLMSQQLQNLSEDTQTSARLLSPLLLQAENLAEQLRLESNTWIRSNQTQPAGPGE